MSDPFDWNDLKAFLAVMRTGRLTVAAKSLRVEHSTLSRRINRLEHALDVKLFERMPAGYQPSSAAEDLVKQAETIESLMIGIQSRFTDQASELTGAVRIAGPEGFGTTYLASRLRRLNEIHPNLEIELIANPRVVSLPKREAEMAITNIRPQKGSLHAFKLTDYELGVYAAREYLSSRPAIVKKAQFDDHPFIGYIDDLLPTPAHDYLNEIGKSIEPRIRLSNILTQLAAAKGALGLCVLPCFMCREVPELVRVLGDEIKIHRSYWLVIHSDLRKIARIRAAADFIADTVCAERNLFLPGHKDPLKT